MGGTPTARWTSEQPWARPSFKKGIDSRHEISAASQTPCRELRDRIHGRKTLGLVHRHARADDRREIRGNVGFSLTGLALALHVLVHDGHVVALGIGGLPVSIS